MADKETLITLMIFAGRNMVENLNHIPDDKWDWKPGPDARSAREIINHMLGNYAVFNGAFGGKAFEPIEDPVAAKAAVRQATEAYAANVRSMTPEKLDETVQMGEMPVPLRTLLWIAVVEICHHHGQISYIQTLLGDTESHFEGSSFALLQ